MLTPADAGRGSKSAIPPHNGSVRFVVAGLVVVAACANTSPPPSGEPIPATDPAGFQQILADLDRPAVVNVWASWCLPCRAEAPLLEQAHSEYGDRIEFIGLDVEDAQAAGQAFVAEFGLTFPQYFDAEGAVPAALGGIGVPRTYFFAPGGELVKLHNGVIDEQTLALQIDELLSR